MQDRYVSFYDFKNEMRLYLGYGQNKQLISIMHATYVVSLEKLSE